MIISQVSYRTNGRLVSIVMMFFVRDFVLGFLNLLNFDKYCIFTSFFLLKEKILNVISDKNFAINNINNLHCHLEMSELNFLIRNPFLDVFSSPEPKAHR